MDGNNSTHWTNTVATDANIKKKTKEEEQDMSPSHSCGVIPALQCCVEVCSPIDWCLPLGLVLSRTVSPSSALMITLAEFGPLPCCERHFFRPQCHLRFCQGTLGGAQLSSPPCEIGGLWHISNIFVCFIVNSC